MRITLKLRAESMGLKVPVHYNHIVQSMIYANVDRALANWIHEEGYRYHKRRFKLFTFSRLLGANRRFDPRTKTIVFKGTLFLKIASVNNDILESLATHFIKRGEITLSNNRCEVMAIEVEAPPRYNSPLLVHALSPIVTYTTFMDPQGRKKTYYYNPREEEFQEQILANLMRKAKALSNGRTIPSLKEAYIRPVKITSRNQVITLFKGTVIKGWRGIFEIHLPKEYFSLAYDSGLGSKNSQGFGMIEVYNTNNSSNI